MAADGNADELTAHSVKYLDVEVASGYTNADYVIVVDATTKAPVLMLISQLDTLIS